MRVLIADDEPVGRAILSRTLEAWDFEVSAVTDGETAWTRLRNDKFAIAIFDWMMPKLDGPELCRRIRRDADLVHLYVVLLSAKDSRHDVVAGLNAGADDYLAKPFNPDELRARMNVARRVVGLQQTLADQVSELQAALSTVRQLKGLLPICSYCKRIRSDEDYWEQIESYIAQHSDAQFSHGICPGCLDQAMKDMEVPRRHNPRQKSPIPRPAE
jgi:phosphoserine phosphatase RsbU/P